MRALARDGEGDASKSAQREALAQAGKLLWFLGARVPQPHLRRHLGDAAGGDDEDTLRHCGDEVNGPGSGKRGRDANTRLRVHGRRRLGVLLQRVISLLPFLHLHPGMQVRSVNHLAEDPIDRAIRLHWQQRLHACCT